MTAAALAGVLGLALVDSTSFGTLILPIMMLIAPDVRRRNVVLYLCTIALFYFLVGVALFLGASAVLEALGALLTTRAGSVIQASLGVVLVVLAFVVHPTSVARRRGRQGPPPKPPGTWRRRALGADATAGTDLFVSGTLIAARCGPDTAFLFGSGTSGPNAGACGVGEAGNCCAKTTFAHSQRLATDLKLVVSRMTFAPFGPPRRCRTSL